VTELIDPRLGPDRSPSPELAAVEQLVRSGAVLTAIGDAIGELE
jgi:hypothetical protein